MPPAKRPAQGVNVGSDYSDEEREFLAAIDHFKASTGKKFPTWTDVLGVIKSLGYVRKRRASP